MVYFFFFWSFLLVLFSFVTRLLLKRKGVAVVSDNAPQTNWYDAVDTQQEEKYDVFVSFRGEDIRDGFLSHLAAAFHRKNIYTFVDERLQGGEEIWPSLVGAIEGSLISVIIFSENYASSTWCLKELIKILECRDKYGHTVIPVFYGIDPTDVRHQTRSYESAFAEHRKKFDPTMLQIWRDALHKSASLSGIKSSDFGNDAELLENIINAVLHQLRRLSKHTLNSKGLVGIGKSIADIEALLLKDSKDVRIIGIWGMGGIGKTTIAEQVFNKMCSEYEGTCFLSNVREDSTRHGIIYMREKLFSTLLAEDVKMKSPNGLCDDIGRRISRMKALIVLDDVNDSDQLELFGTVDKFGPGSRIIVTTRDQQVFANKVDGIHEVGVLSYGEALELFNLIALKQSHLEMEYHETSKRIVNYAKGIPLVLKVLGHLLCGKDQKAWKSQLDKLKKMPSIKVYDVMKLSYDDLDRKEKKIFLDLACFFNGMKMEVDSIEALLKDDESDNSVANVLERLKDKALIIISEDTVVSVHDIIEEIAWEIVRQESSENIGSQSQVADADDIDEVLEKDKGTEAIRSIRMDLPTIVRKNLKLSSNMFARMTKLQFLDFYCDWYNDRDQSDLLPEGLQSFPNKVRYLRWMYYPLKSLPDKFSAEKLVMLDMSHSEVEKLWDGVQNLVNLKQVKLVMCKFLKELPNFSKATNLEVLNAAWCLELTDVHPSVFSLAKLVKLDLSECSSLTSLTSNAQLSCQFQENQTKVLFWNCMSLDERSLMAIGLNAQINVFKFAQQHLSALKHDFVENYDDYSRNYDSYQSVHVFPGSRVPEWLEYKTTGDSVIIDLSSHPPSPLFGFIFCLLIDRTLNEFSKLDVRVTISDSSGEDNSGEDDAGEDEKDTVEVCISSGLCYSGDGDHVCVIYDKRCSRYLSRRSQNLSRFQIKVTKWRYKVGVGVQRLESKGFGVSLISTTKYDSFVRQME